MSKKIKKTGKIAIVLSVVLTLVVLYNVIPFARAAELSSRSVRITDPRISVNADYIFTATHTASNTKCIEVDFCTTATGTCTGPTGLTTVGGDKGDVGDWSGWTYASWSFSSVDADTARLTFATGESGGSGYKFVMGNLTNPSTEGANDGTYFARIHTYSNSDCTSEIDSGNVAFSIKSGVSVSATVAETLTFTISEAAIGFGEFGTTNIRYATADEVGQDTTEPVNGQPSVLSVSTNASSGVMISIQDVGNSSNAGLYSSGASKLVAATAPNAVVGGTESYAPYAKNASDLTIQSGWEGTGTSVVTLSPQLFLGRLSAGSGTADLVAKAGISTLTPAGNYSDTLILVATPTY